MWKGWRSDEERDKSTEEADDTRGDRRITEKARIERKRAIEVGDGEERGSRRHHGLWNRGKVIYDMRANLNIMTLVLYLDIRLAWKPICFIFVAQIIELARFHFMHKHLYMVQGVSKGSACAERGKGEESGVLKVLCALSGKAVDQGAAHMLMFIALLVTYIVH
ncbi:uncharacterized protein A4U43_C01F25730 [Asparagus officinalis]|uniref:Uncharacterized protein n=1 Tax=Asparagus officinalis TaxID=4686 RepID=A0A5P1FW89_ASPOF|nr:uncharacterized protein A4U43_C01F25730 [Asparagus officinalis]